MSEKIKKLKVSKEQFAGILYCWLSGNLTNKAIKKMARELRFKIKGNKDFSRIFEELFFLNMWLIVYTCEGVFENEKKRNECLDIFHHLIYTRHIENKKNNFNDWMRSLYPGYVKYNKAMGTEHPSTPLWVVANIVNKRLFGKIKKDPILQMKIVIYIGLVVEHLGKLIKQYDID